MYKTFYQLERNPFEITPDPAFLFPTNRHNEALASLYYGVRLHKGFIVLTGEVGTGKTLLLRCLLQLLKLNREVAYAYLFNSRLSPTEFVQYIATDFGLPVTGKNKGQILFDLCNYVVTRGMKKLTTVLIVDEAHHLSIDALEEVRLLTNLETVQEKLLQIILVGQPELDEKLDSVRLRQLKQRVALRTQLEPFDSEETKKYIERRLELAGANSHAETLFPPQTVAAVYRYSHGIPRLINTICENALITAYAKRNKSVTPDFVHDIAKDFRLEIVHPGDIDADQEFDGADVRRAAKALLDLYASLQKSTAREPEWAMPAVTRLP